MKKLACLSREIDCTQEDKSKMLQTLCLRTGGVVRHFTHCKASPLIGSDETGQTVLNQYPHSLTNIGRYSLAESNCHSYTGKSLDLHITGKS
jgi:hypothetical protein